MSSYGWISILPPLVALGIALWKKQIIPALLVGCLAGEFILISSNFSNVFFHFLERSVQVGGAEGNLKLIVFSLFIGGLIALIEESGGFAGFIKYLEKRPGFASKRGSFLLTWIIGIVIIFECWGNILINGTTLKSLYDKLGLSREKLAYFIHTIAINVVAVAIINSWGAYYMSVLSTQDVQNPFSLVLSSIPYNFYSISSLLLVAIVMITGKDIGPMSTTTTREANSIREGVAGSKGSISNLLVPVGAMIVTLMATLYYTGEGTFSNGSGTTAVFYGVIFALVAVSVLILAKRELSLAQLMETFFQGVGKFTSVGVLLVLALVLGELCKELGTGLYIAELAKQNVPTFLVPALIFIISGIMAFSTGTSYGTFAIMFPIALPIASLTGIEPSILIGASLSGGIFGDNCSPISDTSIVTSIASEVEVVQHVRTQLPYALIAGSFAIICFLIVGLIEGRQ